MNSQRVKGIKEIEAEINELQQQAKDIRQQEKLDTLASHREYMGQCFKHRSTDGENTTYYKVISEVSENKYWVECAVFELPLEFAYKRKTSMTDSRYPDAKISCSPFNVVSYPLFTSDNLSKLDGASITEEEYLLAMNECYKQFNDLIGRTDLSKIMLDK